MAYVYVEDNAYVWEIYRSFRKLPHGFVGCNNLVESVIFNNNNNNNNNNTTFI